LYNIYRQKKINNKNQKEIILMHMTSYIYSQLEAGKTAEEIRGIFEKDLSTAQKKYTQEKQAVAQRKADIDAARQELLKATEKYAALVSGDSNQEVSNLKTKLQELENTIDNETNSKAKFHSKWYLYHPEYKTLKDFLKDF
jgi:small-conductance mechanosensitive channel